MSERVSVSAYLYLGPLDGMRLSLPARRVASWEPDCMGLPSLVQIDDEADGVYVLEEGLPSYCWSSFCDHEGGCCHSCARLRLEVAEAMRDAPEIEIDVDSLTLRDVVRFLRESGSSESERKKER